MNEMYTYKVSVNGLIYTTSSLTRGLKYEKIDLTDTIFTDTSCFNGIVCDTIILNNGHMENVDVLSISCKNLYLNDVEGLSGTVDFQKVHNLYINGQSLKNVKKIKTSKSHTSILNMYDYVGEIDASSTRNLHISNSDISKLASLKVAKNNTFNCVYLPDVLYAETSNYVSIQNCENARSIILNPNAYYEGFDDCRMSMMQNKRNSMLASFIRNNCGKERTI